MIEVRLWDTEDCARAWQELSSQVGNYDWMWRILRLRTKQTGKFLPQKLHRSLCRFARKPYFIGTTPGGIRYCGKVSDSYAAICATFQDTEEGLTQFLTQQIGRREGDYLDIGTNIGIVAATVAKNLPNNRTVIAFEPMPETAKCAAATFALNGLQNVRLFCGAVGERDSELSLYTRPGYSEAASLTKREGIDDWQEITVPVRTLDTLHVDGLIDRASFLKFDVEGYEPQAISGAKSLIASQNPGVVYEFHPHIAPKLGWTAEQVAAQLSEYAPYTFHTLDKEGNCAAFPPPASKVVNIFAEPKDAGHFNTLLSSTRVFQHSPI